MGATTLDVGKKAKWLRLSVERRIDGGLLCSAGCFLRDERQARLAAAIIAAVRFAEQAVVVDDEDGHDVAVTGVDKTELAQAGGVTFAIREIFEGAEVPEELLSRLEAAAEKASEE